MSATKSEIYVHKHDMDLGISVHEQDAIGLGFAWNHGKHCRVTPMAGGTVLMRPEPLSLQFFPTAQGGQLKTADYRRCAICGEDHEPLVIAFLERYRQEKDARLLKVSEERAKEWQEAGLGRGLAEELADSPYTEEEVRKLLKLGPYSEPRVAPTEPAAGVAEVADSTLREAPRQDTNGVAFEAPSMA